MITEIPEFRQMFEAGQRYLAGSCSIQELNGHIAECATAIKFWGRHPALCQTVVNWAVMVDRYWNEWGHTPNPLSEHDFRTWLQAQLILLEQRPNEAD